MATSILPVLSFYKGNAPLPLPPGLYAGLNPAIVDIVCNPYPDIRLMHELFVCLFHVCFMLTLICLIVLFPYYYSSLFTFFSGVQCGWVSVGTSG